MVAPYEFQPDAIAHAAINLGMSIPWDQNAVGVSGAGVAVSLTFTPSDLALFVEIGQIEFSYSAAPTGGRLTITDDGNTVEDIDVNVTGAQFLQFLQPRCTKLKGKNVIVTLAGGGGAVVGKLNVHAWCRR